MARSEGVGRLHRLLSSWLGEHLATRRGASDGTVRAYRQSMAQLARWLRDERGVRFDEVTFDHLSRESVYGFLCWLRDERGLSASTLNLRLSAVKSFLRYCGEEDLELAGLYLQVKSIRPFKGKGGGTGVEYLTEPQLKALLAEPDATTRLGRRDRFAMVVAYEAGLRMQELLDLTVGSVERHDGYVTLRVLGKGSRLRHVPLASDAVAHLDAYLEEFHPDPDPADWLIYTVHGGSHTQMSQSNVDAMLKKYARAIHARDASFPESVHEHMLRHSVATLMRKEDVPLPYVRDFLGHASVQTTMIYAHADESSLAEAVERSVAGSACGDGPAEEKRWKGKEQYLLELCGLA